MSSFRSTLRIGDIGFAMESEREFRLSKRCEAFEAELDRPDVTIHLTQGTRDLSGSTAVFRAADCDVLRSGEETVTVRYANARKDQIVWYMRQTAPDAYELMFAEGLSWAFTDLNPLFIFDLAEFLTGYDAMILHSSVIRLNGIAVAFTAPCQTGKSTQADLWHRYKGAKILNGDRGLIRRTADGYRIYGSPYAGSSGIYVNESAPLKALVVLKQAPYNRICRLRGRQAYLHLISQISLSRWNKATVEKQTELVLDLLGQVPVYLLECLPDQDAVETLYQELEGQFNE